MLVTAAFAALVSLGAVQAQAKTQAQPTSAAPQTQIFAQQQSLNLDAKLAGMPPASIKAQLPKLDAKAVSAANQQQQEAGINELCAQSLTRVAASWKTAAQSVQALNGLTAGTAVEPAVQAAGRFMSTQSNLINPAIRAGMKTDASAIKSYEGAGVAIGQAMGAISQVQQIQGQKPEVTQAANVASINLQNLRTAQFATFGACGAAVGATIAATDEAKPAGIPGSSMKVVCGH